MVLGMVSAVCAGLNQIPANPSFEALVRTGQVARPKVGISWLERVMWEREVMRRGSEMRNLLMRAALNGEEEDMKGVTVNSYNARVRGESPAAEPEDEDVTNMESQETSSQEASPDSQ